MRSAPHGGQRDDWDMLTAAAHNTPLTDIFSVNAYIVLFLASTITHSSALSNTYIMPALLSEHDIADRDHAIPVVQAAPIFDGVVADKGEASQMMLLK